MKFLLALVLLVQQQQPQTSVQGTVVKAGTTSPIEGALVELRRSTTPLTLIASGTTGADGKFNLQNVPPGDYRLIAQHPSGAYVRTEYLQRNPQMHGATLTVSGQPLRDLQIGMLSTGSISGHVVDVDGEPASAARVMALQVTYRDGQRVMNVVQALLTNDNGDYRLFWLPPGDYYIAVQTVDQRMSGFIEQVIPPGRLTFREDGSSPVVTRRVIDGGESVEEIRIPAYFSGGTDASLARVVNLGSGQNVGGIDVSLAGTRVRTFHVRGIVSDAATGQPVDRTAIRLIPKSYEGAYAILPTARTDAKGAFDVAGVPPGSYWLFAVAGGQAFGGLQYGGFNGPGLNLNNGTNALLSLEVGSSPLDNVNIAVRPGRAIPIHVTADGGSINFSGVNIGIVRNPDLLGMPTAQTARLAPDGTVTVTGVGPGDYRLEVTGLPPDAYVKSARMEQDDLAAAGLHVSNETKGTIELVVGVNGGTLDGTTSNLRREPLPNATVVLVPDTPLRAQASSYKVSATDPNGNFSIRGINPGTYRLFAWESVTDGEWQDPTFLSPYENRGVAVRVSEGSRQTLQLTAIPAGVPQ